MPWIDSTRADCLFFICALPCPSFPWLLCFTKENLENDQGFSVPAECLKKPGKNKTKHPFYQGNSLLKINQGNANNQGKEGQGRSGCEVQEHCFFLYPCWELKNIYHHPESEKRKSSEANSGSIHPYGRHGNAVKTRKTISTIAILWPARAIFEKRAATVEVDSFVFLYPCSGFWYPGTSAKPPFWKPPFCEPPSLVHHFIEGEGAPE